MHECTRLYTHTTHTYMHTHTLTQIGLVPLAALDFGLLFLTLYSQSMYMCKNTLAHCYVNSPYTIIVTNTYTHTYTHTHMCTHTHTCIHTLVHTHCYVHCLYTIYLSHIQHIHIQYTCIVTEMESCAQHIHTLMYSTPVRTHTNEKH